MENGIAIIEVNRAETKSVFIDQDVIECARLNKRIKQRVEQAEAVQRAEDRKQRKTEKAAAMRKRYTVRTFLGVLTRCGISASVMWAAEIGMINPVISVSVALFCLITACLRFGVWVGNRI